MDFFVAVKTQIKEQCFTRHSRNLQQNCLVRSGSSWRQRNGVKSYVPKERLSTRCFCSINCAPLPGFAFPIRRDLFLLIRHIPAFLQALSYANKRNPRAHNYKARPFRRPLVGSFGPALARKSHVYKHLLPAVWTRICLLPPKKSNYSGMQFGLLSGRLALMSQSVSWVGLRVRHVRA